MGANDAAENAAQGVPIEEYGNNLRMLGVHMLARVCNHLIIIGPPPVDATAWPDRNNDRVAMYAAAAGRAASSLGAPFVDSCALFLSWKPTEDGYKELLFDGLHVSADGGTLLVRAILETLRAPKAGAHGHGCAPEQLPLDFPTWDAALAVP